MQVKFTGEPIGYCTCADVKKAMKGKSKKNDKGILKKEKSGEIRESEESKNSGEGIERHQKESDKKKKSRKKGKKSKAVTELEGNEGGKNREVVGSSHSKQLRVEEDRADDTKEKERIRAEEQTDIQSEKIRATAGQQHAEKTDYDTDIENVYRAQKKVFTGERSNDASSEQTAEKADTVNTRNSEASESLGRDLNEEKSGSGSETRTDYSSGFEKYVEIAVEGGNIPAFKKQENRLNTENMQVNNGEDSDLDDSDKSQKGSDDEFDESIKIESKTGREEVTGSMKDKNLKLSIKVNHEGMNKINKGEGKKKKSKKVGKKKHEVQKENSRSEEERKPDVNNSISEEREDTGYGDQIELKEIEEGKKALKSEEHRLSDKSDGIEKGDDKNVRVKMISERRNGQKKRKELNGDKSTSEAESIESESSSDDDLSLLISNEKDSRDVQMKRKDGKNFVDIAENSRNENAREGYDESDKKHLTTDNEPQTETVQKNISDIDTVIYDAFNEEPSRNISSDGEEFEINEKIKIKSKKKETNLLLKKSLNEMSNETEYSRKYGKLSSEGVNNRDDQNNTNLKVRNENETNFDLRSNERKPITIMKRKKHRKNRKQNLRNKNTKNRRKGIRKANKRRKIEMFNKINATEIEHYKNLIEILENNQSAVVDENGKQRRIENENITEIEKLKNVYENNNEIGSTTMKPRNKVIIKERKRKS